MKNSQRCCERMGGAGMIPSVIRFGKSWAIPEDAPKPTRTVPVKPGPKPKKVTEI